ncbi:hypothetical protein H8356DRAFT_1351232 [Neocallimastix lanati (nom. inval.)]|nr:hypothetical protein H8356DRAFT_1351232 [Neocallimastix sp. JGI-2020a]
MIVIWVKLEKEEKNISQVTYFLFIKAELYLLDDINDCFSIGTLNFTSTNSLSAFPVRSFPLNRDVLHIVLFYHFITVKLFKCVCLTTIPVRRRHSQRESCISPSCISPGCISTIKKLQYRSSLCDPQGKAELTIEELETAILSDKAYAMGSLKCFISLNEIADLFQVSILAFIQRSVVIHKSAISAERSLSPETMDDDLGIELLAHMGTHLPYGHTLRRSQSSLHTARRCIPNVPTYISNDHEHQNGTINSSLVGVIIGDWKFYNHQGLCFNSKRSIRVGLMDITCGLMISQDRNLIQLFGAIDLYRPNRLDQHGNF